MPPLPPVRPQQVTHRSTSIGPAKDRRPHRRTASIETSSKALEAVDLARDKSRPLHIPPMLSLRPGAKNLENLTIFARKVAPGILKDETGQYYAISPVLAHGTFGNIRLGLRYDPIISQIWIFKEIGSRSPTQAEFAKKFAQAPKPIGQYSVPTLHNKLFKPLMTIADETPEIGETREESLQFEVNLMHQANSPLAPHAVLRTEDKAIMMLPLADTDLHNVWFSMNGWEPKKRRPIVLAVARQLIQELQTLHESGSAHRDIKPKNIFLTREGATFLGDFGMASPLGQVDGHLGSYSFLAPEVLYDHQHDKRKSDIFSVGAVLTGLLTNRGFFWDELWAKEDIIEGMRSNPPSEKAIDRFTNVDRNYKLAFSRPARAGESRNLPLGGARRMHKQLVDLQAAYPEMFKLLKSMQHPNPDKRPTAKIALERCNEATPAPTDADGAELRTLLANSDRPIRAAADEQALILEAKVRAFMQEQQARATPRRNSVGSIDDLSSYFAQSVKT